MPNYSHFKDILEHWPPERVQELIGSRSEADIKHALNAAGRMVPENLAALLSPAADPFLEQMAEVSAHWTRQRFGRAVQFFAPLYVSNFCVNGCRYCGFNTATENAVRNALTLDEAESEARCLAEQGFRNILLVSGEDRKHTPPEYFAELARRIKQVRPTIAVLYMSGYPAEHVAHRGVLTDATWFLPKPFSLSTLTAKIVEVLGESG